MSRLPTPGSDDGNWGNILNDFLNVEHDTNGNLKLRTDGTFANLNNGKVPTSQLGTGTADTTTFLRGDNTWAVPSTGGSGAGMSDPTTTKGDLIAHGSSTTRLAVGSDNQVLTADSTQVLGVKWATPSATDNTKVPLSTVTAKGDLIAGTGNATVARLGAGSDGQVLSADSTQSSGLKWIAAGSTSQLKGVAVYVEDYGAAGDGTTDDTIAINNAVNAAVVAAASNNHYAEVRFQSKTYLVAGSLTQGGSTKSNALLALPMVSSTAHKITLCFKGAGEAAALPIGTQAVGQKTGTVLKTTVSAANDSTYGEASLLGGPTDVQGGGYNNNNPLFTNLCVVIDGIDISLPNNPQICGMDFRGVAEVVIKSAGVFVDAGVSSIAAPTAIWQFAVAMPEARNNALCHIERLGVYGSNFGIRSSEHTTAEWFAAVLCNVGIAVGKASGPHHSRYTYACIELCNIAVGATDQYGYIDIAMLDWEGTAGNFNTNFSSYAIVEDSNYITNGGFPTQYNKLQGTIHINNNGDPLYNRGSMIHGGGLLSIYCANTASGDPIKTYNLQQPGVPSSGTAFANPFWRDAAVYISSGTVTAIKVDGISTGVTNGMVMVPTGRTIEIDYSVAPTWLWSFL